MLEKDIEREAKAPVLASREDVQMFMGRMGALGMRSESIVQYYLWSKRKDTNSNGRETLVFDPEKLPPEFAKMLERAKIVLKEIETIRLRFTQLFSGDSYWSLILKGQNKIKKPFYQRIERESKLTRKAIPSLFGEEWDLLKFLEFCSHDEDVSGIIRKCRFLLSLPEEIFQKFGFPLNTSCVDIITNSLVDEQYLVRLETEHEKTRKAELESSWKEFLIALNAWLEFSRIHFDLPKEGASLPSQTVLALSGKEQTSPTDPVKTPANFAHFLTTSNGKVILGGSL